MQEFSEVYRANVCPTFKTSSCESARSLCRIYIEPVLGQYRLDQIKGEVPQLARKRSTTAGAEPKDDPERPEHISKHVECGSGLELSCTGTRLAQVAVAR